MSWAADLRGWLETGGCDGPAHLSIGLAELLYAVESYHSQAVRLTRIGPLGLRSVQPLSCVDPNKYPFRVLRCSAPSFIHISRICPSQRCPWQRKCY